MKNNFKKCREQSGFALVGTLLLMALIGMLTLSATALIQYSNAQISVSCDLSRSFYAAESAVNRTIMALYRDIRMHPDRKLGQTDYAMTGTERYLADSVVHEYTIDDRLLRTWITDANSGIDVSSHAPEQNLREAFREIIGNDANAQEEFEYFLDKVTDYIDSDDFVGTRGMESMHYRLQGIPALPRNGALQFREELLSIPDAKKYLHLDETGLLSMIRVIPPDELRKTAGRMNLYAAPLALLRAGARMNDEESEEFKSALRQWRIDRKRLSDTLDPALYSRLSGAFSMHETGIYVISADSAMIDYPGRRLSVMLRIDSLGPVLEFYEFRVY